MSKHLTFTKLRLGELQTDQNGPILGIKKAAKAAKIDTPGYLTIFVIFILRIAGGTYWKLALQVLS